MSITPQFYSTCGILQGLFLPPMEQPFGFTPGMAQSLPKLVAEAAAELQQNEGLTQAEMVAKTGVGAGTINRALQGQNLRLKTLEELARAWNLSPWMLLVPGFNPRRPPRLIGPEVQGELADLRAQNQALADDNEALRLAISRIQEAASNAETHAAGDSGHSGDSPPAGKKPPSRSRRTRAIHKRP